MNPHDIPEASGMFLFFMKAVEWLNPMIYALGLGLAVWAFLRCRKCGYFVLALYFAIVLFSLLAMPSINRAIRARRAPDISEQTQKKIDAAVQQSIDRVLEEEGHPIMAAKKTIHFPFGPIVLVVGLWLVARHEIRSNKSPQATATTLGS
jgi:hypothetical protein